MTDYPYDILSTFTVMTEEALCPELPRRLPNSENIVSLYKSLASNANKNDCHVMLLKTVSVHGEWGYIKDKSGSGCIGLMQEIGWSPNHISNYEANSVSLQDDCSATRLQGIVVSVLWPGVMTYGHWLLDIIPRVELVRRSGVPISDVTFLIPKGAPGYMRTFLSAFGARNFAEVGGKTYVLVDSLVIVGKTRVPLYLPHSLYMSAFDVVKAHFTQSDMPTFSEKGHFLNVKHTPMTSKHVDNRYLSNQEEMTGLMSECGFLEIDPLSLSLTDQVLAFSSAVLVAGVDSSALHNILFANSADFSALIVFSSSRRINYNHYAIAAFLGAAIYDLEGRISDDDGGFEVDKGLVAEVLNEAVRKA